MVYGMSYEQYWYGDPWMVKAYEQAFMLRQRKRNEEMWIQGAYIANAVSVSIANAFDKRKHEYLKAPFDIYPKTAAEEQEEIRQERIKLVQTLSMFAKRHKQKQQQKGTDEHGKP